MKKLNSLYLSDKDIFIILSVEGSDLYEAPYRSYIQNSVY